VYADNYRCLVNFTFRPEKLNLLIGDNGTGKTSLVRVLENIRDFALTGIPAARLFAFTKTRWESRDVQRLELEVEIDGVYVYVLELRHPSSPAGQVVVQSETLTFDAKPLFRYADGTVNLTDDAQKLTSFPFRPDVSYLSNIDARPLKLATFREWLRGVWSFQLNPFAADVASRQDSQVLAANGSNFASWYRYLNEALPAARESLQQRLSEVIPSFRRFSFQGGPDQKLLLATFSNKSGIEHQVAFGELSEGIKTLATLYSILHGLPSTHLLCFDEPENFVALREIQPWLQDLRDRIDERGTQAFVISHHPEVIDYLASGNVFRFDRPNGDVVRCEEARFDRLHGVKASEQIVLGQ
jgi:energy-coupling factor transporter ATP-binding protein EcfA2